jgi:hypothetical protein
MNFQFATNLYDVVLDSGLNYRLYFRSYIVYL